LPTAVVKFLQDLQASRYYTFLYVSVWKIVCFFCTMLLATHFQFGSLGVEDLFNLFSETFSQRNISVTEVRTKFDDVGVKKSLFEGPAVTGRKILSGKIKDTMQTVLV
jgi:hypothetical protein